ncbi:glycosyltransferase [Aureimonas sp. SA4125]|uniref:glycosyltransferase n=1 Tax=Aureimonas sp. SA4125 TaxID=2826993 RepID=UPI001CC5A861|nr:glycosyltransferase [Aureimonas sp. SA4125]
MKEIDADRWTARRMGRHRSRKQGGRPTRAVFVLAGLDAGGTEKIVNMLAHHRVARGDTVDVVALNAESAGSFFPYQEGIAIHALGDRTGPRFLRSLVRFWRLRRLLHRLQPDVALSFLTKVNVITAIAATGLGISLILSERNNFLIQKMHPLWPALFARVAQGRRLVMQTAQARSALPAALQSDAVVIPNPISPPPPIWELPDYRPAFVAVGRLDRQKGFDLLIDAFASALPRLPSASLAIFGEGPERRSLEEQMRALGLGERAVLPGVAKSPDDWMAAGSVFVLSSRFEGFPNVLLEALARGAPVVAFDCPWGPSEILRASGGYPLVPPGDTDALAEALVRVDRDPELRRRMADAGPAIAAGYTPAVVFAKWDALIDDAMRERTVRVADPAAERTGPVCGGA